MIHQSALVVLRLPSGLGVAIGKVGRGFALHLGARGVKVGIAVGAYILAVVDTDLTDLDPALRIGRGKADAQVATGHVELLGTVGIAIVGSSDIGLGVSRVHVARVLGVMREPSCGLGGVAVERVGDLSVGAIDLENLGPLAIGSVRAVGDLDNTLADEIIRGLGHIVRNGVDRTLLTKVEHDCVALGGTLGVLEGRGQIAVEDLRGVKVAQVALHIRGSLNRLVAGREVGEGHVTCSGGLDAHEASLDRLLSAGVVKPLERILRVHDLGALRERHIVGVDSNIVAHGAQVNRQVVTGPKRDGAVGELDVAVLGRGLEAHTGDVGADGAGAGFLALRGCDLADLPPELRVCSRAHADAANLDILEVELLLKIGVDVAALDPVGAIDGVLERTGREFVAALDIAHVAHSLGSGVGNGDGIAALDIATAGVVLNPSVRILVAVDYAGKRVGLVHIQARARNRSGGLGRGGCTLGGGKLIDLPPRLGSSSVLNANGLCLNGARQRDSLRSSAVDIASLNPRAGLVLILKHASVDAITRGGLVAVARCLHERKRIDLGRLGKREGHRGAGLRGVADVVIRITRVDLLVLKVSIRRNIAIVDVGERLAGQNLAIDGHGARNGLTLGSLVFLVDLNLVDRRPGVAAVVLRGNQTDAVDALDIQAGNGNGRAGQVALALNVVPVFAVEGLELGMLHVVGAVALDKRHVGKIEGLALDHAKVGTGRELVGVLVNNTRICFAVKDVFGLTLGGVGAAGHKTRGVGVGVGRNCGALTKIVVKGIEHRHDVCLAHRGILGVINIVEAVLARGGERLGTLGILGEHLGAVT